MGGRDRNHLRRRGLAALLAAAVLTSACTPLYRNHGYAPSSEELAGVLPGVDTRDTVADVIGPPSAGGVLDGSGYYYVQSRFRTVGPFRPTEIDREVVAIYFDADGVVENIERFGLEAGRVVVLERRITEDRLRDTTFIRQLMGNIGNVNAGDFIGEP